MKTPAFRPFLDSVGHIVHYLNTITIGLAGVESGQCTKPETLDISWNPRDIMSSSRGARRFVLNSSTVFLAEELSAYTTTLLGCPGFKSTTLTGNADRATKFIALHQHLKLPEDHLFVGALLAINWRNTIIHKRSNARLTNAQKKALIDDSLILYKDYKHLNAEILLDHFDKKQPSLKDVSSLIALSINCVRRIEGAISEPRECNDVVEWLVHLELYDMLKRVVRAAPTQQKKEQAVKNFFATHCPELADSYQHLCKELLSSL